MTDEATYIPQKLTFFQKVQLTIFKFFKLHKGPKIKLYPGFSNGNSFFICGHALSLSPMEKNHYRHFFLYNAIALFRLFMVRPKKNAVIKLLFNNTIFETTTEKDGFFKFTSENIKLLPAGTYTVKALLIKRRLSDVVKAETVSQIIVPSSTSFSFISDIDDTFLISHSSNFRKRLFVLLTENPRSRKPFEGAVKHYRLLHGIDDVDPSNNSFFYVSSSEWNLYDYINDFVEEYKLPPGVFLLNQLKTFSKLFATGQGKHHGKFTRIVKIIETFPHQKFVLLGDDSQKDIDIYTAIVEHFPQNVYCVYIRRVGTPEKEIVLQKQKLIEAKGVLFYYFSHSENAINHSRKVGLINEI